jgi:hypothetical protein
VPFGLRRRVRRIGPDRFELKLPEAERALMRSLPGQLRELLLAGEEDPSLARLFPPAYDDPEADAEYRALMRDELLAKRLAALETVEKTADATTLDEAELLAWLGAINDLRLVLGTRLDVTEDVDIAAIPDDHPDASSWAVYSYLSWLQEQVVAALDPEYE